MSLTHNPPGRAPPERAALLVVGRDVGEEGRPLEAVVAGLAFGAELQAARRTAGSKHHQGRCRRVPPLRVAPTSPTASALIHPPSSFELLGLLAYPQ